MATVTEILNQALNLNRKTQSDALISTLAPEVVDAVNRSNRGIYQIGARVNPSYFGDKDLVGEAGGVWVKPTASEIVVKVEQASDGAEVFFSTPKEPVPDPEKLYLVKWGPTWTRPTGETNPTGNLDVYYSRRPTDVAALADTVDLEDFFQSLLVADLGAWIAHKDERFDEKAIILQARDAQLQLLVSSLQNDVANLQRNVGQMGLIDTQQITELKSLLLS